MQYGYARVSTIDQNPALQIDALRRAGCQKIFKDEGISGFSLSGSSTAWRAACATWFR
jgi:DNA invertase Pin-like site-specific DNA recombinase